MSTRPSKRRARRFPSGRRLVAHARSRYLYALARQVQKHSRLLAVLETLDNGKPIRESRDIDIPLVARHFYHHAGWAQILAQEFPDFTACGVVGQIIPWNFPLLMLAWKIAPALATGNTVVLKPAEFTPLSALAFAGICQEIGLPAGVVNIVTGDGSTGEALVKHPDVDKIAFTGSTEVGRAIRRATAASHKRLSLELGGKSPFIVFEDADLDSVVEGLVDGIWFNQGQVCCAGSRLLMQESIAEPLIARIRDRMSRLRVGSPLDKAIDIGAIVARVQLDRIQKLVEQGIAEGATCWQPELQMPSQWFVFPTNTAEQRASDVDRRAAGDFWTGAGGDDVPHSARKRSNSRTTPCTDWLRVCGARTSTWPCMWLRRLKAGVVWVNCTNLFDAACGFGGYRESGYGREGGREGLVEYLEPIWFKNAPMLPSAGDGPERIGEDETDTSIPAIDRTVKLYIGGKQARPDSGYSHAGARPRTANRWVKFRWEIAKTFGMRWKRRARQAGGQGALPTTGHRFFITWRENLSQRRDEIARRLAQAVGEGQASAEVNAGIERIFSYAAWADKFDGAVHNPPFRNIAIAMHEALGTVGVICPREAPLLGFLSVVMPLLAMGNTVIAVPSETYPLITGDLYQLFDTSDLPGGAVNLVTGYASQLLKVLAEHDDVDAIWCFGDEANAAAAKSFSTGNLKQVFTNEGRAIDWFDVKHGRGTLVPATCDAGEKHLGSVRRVADLHGTYARSPDKNLLHQFNRGSRTGD